MKRPLHNFAATDRWELWVRPNATGGRWKFHAVGTYAECFTAMDAMGGRGMEYSIRRAT